jgi:GNAT superfamily N-acetyltransferase
MTTPANPSLDLKSITISPLGAAHSLGSFACGNTDLDKFINRKAQKYHAKNRVKVFCAHPRTSPNIYGIYTLTMRIEETNKLLTAESENISDKHFPAIYIGTLAVARHYQSHGLGTILLINALQRAYYVAQNVAVFGVALRSLNERTTKFYQKYGFGVRDQGATPLMVLPVWSLNDLFEKPTKQAT